MSGSEDAEGREEAGSKVAGGTSPKGGNTARRQGENSEEELKTA